MQICLVRYDCQAGLDRVCKTRLMKHVSCRTLLPTKKYITIVYTETYDLRNMQATN